MQTNNQNLLEPQKIPAEALLKYAHQTIKKKDIEIGQLKSRIDELEHLTNAEILEIKSQSYYQQLRSHIRKLESKLRNLNKENERLFIKSIGK